LRSAIIGIGASAGGLEAISELLAEMPDRLGAAVLVVQHLERSHGSLLSGILRRRTAMPVLAAADGMAAKPDHVYVIPPNVTLTVAAGHMVLTPRAPGRAVHKPVDALFRSLAEECGERAVGVVLSGADSDGSEGITAIKLAGGITFAQTPETAGTPSMPLSAIETGHVDFVLPPAEIARELVRLAKHPYLQPADTEEPVAQPADEGETLRRIFRRVRAVHGVDFARYKPATLRRRLARRMAVQKIDDLPQYAELLDNDGAETAALYQDFLIRVTSFFRDPDSFRALGEQVFPKLAATRSAKDPIRIWVPGCATGEEVYSIAIALIESMGQSAPSAGIQIFGTDVSESAIEKCRAGVYPESIALDVSPDRLRRFFVKQGTQYVIARAIRDLCVFARHDITRDPPYSRLDFVSCRNLLIYLGPAAQNRVMQVFRYALRPQGYLLLGPSESLGQGEEFFESVDKQHRLYRPKGTLAAVVLGVGADQDRPAGGVAPLPVPRHETDFIESDAVQKQADRLLLARYSPACILVDEHLNILQFRGETAPYLAPASGTPSLHLSRIARPELLLSVPALIQEARQTGKPVNRPAVAIENVGAVDLEVIPLTQTGGTKCFLIILENQAQSQAQRRDRRAPPAPLTDSERDRHLADVERENFELREFLRATMEQHEVAKEELKSAHEEVLSANEEFQSTNEELETSKEELQSANEELTTTNDELRERNRQLAVLNVELEKARNASERARAYADGIVETVQDPLVVLDGGLRVLRANRAFCEEFKVAPGSIDGHSLDVVSKALWDESLNEKLTAILTAGPLLTDFEVIYNHPLSGTRLLSLNGRKIAGDSERGELILLSLEDVTESRRRNDALKEGNRRKDEFLAMLAHELRNPLGAISHAITVLKQGSPQHVQAMHAMIERQCGRLVRLVNDLLDVARVSRGLIELKREPIDLVTIVREATEAARGRLESQRHVLTVSVPDFPVGVEGDPVRLEQVVANLLENAIKYTPPGGRISISLSEEGGESVIRVRDNGIGIPPANIRQVFDIFTQLQPSLTGGGGLGLGLTVVRRILELHGGRIEARSEGKGMGSEFIARLPRMSSERLRPRAEPRAIEMEPGNHKRVLVVDDNEDSAAVMALVFEHWGHEVKTAGSATAALKLLETFRADVAFIDIGLPDIDGHELARRLRDLPANCPRRLVALTGYGTAADNQRSIEAGFDEHIVKPADVEALARNLGAQGAS
jgi:two-component system, chemotaxis family, CheB/CheR fusion protein